MALTSFLKWMLLFGITLLVLYSFNSANKTPCDRPITYSIGRIDPEFKLQDSEAESYVQAAASLWNYALDKTVLQQDSNGKVVIDFVFDERQRQTLRNQEIASNIGSQQQGLYQLKEDVLQLKAQHQSAIVDFEREQAQYRARLSEFNNRVSYWNNQGGADAQAHAELSAEKQALSSDAERLDRKMASIRSLEVQINDTAERHNQIVSDVNQQVTEVNQHAGEEFQEGIYNTGTRRITIFQYASIEDLKRVLAHELGHALQIPHVGDSSAIMYYKNSQSGFKLSFADVEALKHVCRLE